VKHPLNSIFDRITRDFQDGLAEYIREIMSRSVDPSKLAGFSGGPDFDAYTILGLARDCSDDEVKRRFRELARILHPDTSRCQGTGFLFTLVNLSYEQIGRERDFK
jgi:DnaJ-class molecular chaperone